MTTNILKSARPNAFGKARAVMAAGLIAFATPALLAAPQPAPAPAASPEIERAVSALRAITTMRADFVQSDARGQRVTGVLTLKRPGRVRFQYEKSVPMLIVGDGASLTVVDYEVRQVQRWPIKNSPLGALLDPNRDVARFARLVPTGHPDVTSVAAKDPRHPEYGTITMIFIRDGAAPGGMRLDSWVALDAQNRETMVRLSYQQYGVVVPENMFRFNDPREATTRK